MLNFDELNFGIFLILVHDSAATVLRVWRGSQGAVRCSLNLRLAFRRAGREAALWSVLLSHCTHGCRQEYFDTGSPPATSPFPVFPAAALGKILGEVSVRLPSALAQVPVLLCNWAIMLPGWYLVFSFGRVSMCCPFHCACTYEEHANPKYIMFLKNK